MPPVLTEIDRRITALWPFILAQQAAHYAEHGRYFQGLETHSALPEDGAEVAPDRAAVSPDYQGVSWADVGGLPAQTMSCLRIDAYVAPGGPGFVLTAAVRLAGERWERSINHGPLAGLEAAWRVVPEE